MAVYIWFIELAAVYPPGALTVDSRPFLNVTQVNTAVINQPITDVAAPWEKNMTYPVNYEGKISGSSKPVNYIFANYRYDKLQLHVTLCTDPDRNPLRSMAALSKFVLFTGRIVEIPPPAGQNMSYTMTFRAPQVSCVETITNMTMQGPPGLEKTLFNASWDPQLGSPENENVTLDFPSPYKAVVFNSTWDTNDTFTLKQIRWFGGFHDNFVGSGNDSESSSEGQTTVVYAGEQKDLICKACSMRFNLNLTYHNGIRHVSYATADPQPLFNYANGTFSLQNVTGTERDKSKVEEKRKNFENWNETLKTAIETWSVFAQIDATLSNMNYTWELWTGTAFNSKVGNFTLDNGTVVELFSINGRDQGNYGKVLFFV
jgi:hypothetical protein